MSLKTVFEDPTDKVVQHKHALHMGDLGVTGWLLPLTFVLTGDKQAPNSVLKKPISMGMA